MSHEIIVIHHLTYDILKQCQKVRLYQLQLGLHQRREGGRERGGKGERGEREGTRERGEREGERGREGKEGNREREREREGKREKGREMRERKSKDRN